jgi:hypothetical protein
MSPSLFRRVLGKADRLKGEAIKSPDLAIALTMKESRRRCGLHPSPQPLPQSGGELYELRID